jgi:hypothetical protein
MKSVVSLQVSLERIRRVSNFTVAGIWLYQGLVPKLLGPHSDELAMSSAFGVPPEFQVPISYAAGVGEVLLGLCILLVQRRGWPQFVSAVATTLLLGFVAIYAPSYLVGAFNPVVMNGASIALSVVALLALRASPTSGTR